jgi:hypothetical protein
MIKTMTVEVPIYDMEEFDTYIEERLNDYTSGYMEQMDDPDDYWSKEEVAHWQHMITHYQELLLQIRSTYTNKNGSMREEFLGVI